MSQWTSIRVRKEVKQQAEADKDQTETWNQYIRRVSSSENKSKLFRRIDDLETEIKRTIEQEDSSIMTNPDCLGCPKDSKTKAEYRWFNGHVSSLPKCETCLRETLKNSVDDLDKVKQYIYKNRGRDSITSGYARPIKSDGQKIVVKDDLDEYINGDNT